MVFSGETTEFLPITVVGGFSFVIDDPILTSLGLSENVSNLTWVAGTHIGGGALFLQSSHLDIGSTWKGNSVVRCGNGGQVVQSQIRSSSSGGC